VHSDQEHKQYALIISLTTAKSKHRGLHKGIYTQTTVLHYNLYSCSCRCVKWLTVMTSCRFLFRPVAQAHSQDSAHTFTSLPCAWPQHHSLSSLTHPCVELDYARNDPSQCIMSYVLGRKTFQSHAARGQHKACRFASWLHNREEADMKHPGQREKGSKI